MDGLADWTHMDTPGEWGKRRGDPLFLLDTYRQKRLLLRDTFGGMGEEVETANSDLGYVSVFPTKSTPFSLPKIRMGWEG